MTSRNWKVEVIPPALRENEDLKADGATCARSDGELVPCRTEIARIRDRDRFFAVIRSSHSVYQAEPAADSIEV
jgi:hypothetical protein